MHNSTGPSSIMAGAAAERDMADESIPENVLFEIFSRMRNHKDLFRCALTCKRWLRLFTDPSFLRQLWPDHDLAAPPLVGFFSNDDDVERRRTQHGYSSVLSFLPTLGSPIGSNDCTLANFVPGYHEPTNISKRVDFLASRRGIVLTQFFHSTFLETKVDGRKAHAQQFFGLCDPITGAHDVLPEVQDTCLFQTTNNGYAILTAADLDMVNHHESSSQFSSLSQLLVVHTDNKNRRQLHVHTYSATTRSWNAPVNLALTNDVFLSCKSAVVHRGSAHWLYVAHHLRCLQILSVEISTGRVSLNSLPIRYTLNTAMLCVSREDRLMIACVRAAQVNVWVLQQDGHFSDPAAWIGAPQAIEIPPWAAPEGPSFAQSFDKRIDWFHINKGTMLGVYYYRRISFIVDLETRATHKVMDLPLPSRMSCCYLPYTMDLPNFFLGQILPHCW